jgi:hypothetical protein
MASEAGKGSKQRPTNRDAFEESYDRIWKKKKEVREGVHYETDTDNLNDIKYDIKYMPEDRYDE